LSGFGWPKLSTQAEKAPFSIFKWFPPSLFINAAHLPLNPKFPPSNAIYALLPAGMFSYFSPVPNWALCAIPSFLSFGCFRLFICPRLSPSPHQAHLHFWPKSKWPKIVEAKWANSNGIKQIDYPTYYIEAKK
jgi:hypothetical protein